MKVGMVEGTALVINGPCW